MITFTAKPAFAWVYRCKVLTRWTDDNNDDWRVVRVWSGGEVRIQVEMWVSQAGWSTIRSVIDEGKEC